MDQDNNIVIHDNGVGAQVVSLSVDQLKESVDQEKQKRAVLKEFVQSQLVEGQDYMVLPFAKNSKPTMLKPGAEKICSLFQLTARYYRDDDTWEMLGKETGVLCYICQLVRGDVVVAEGRGSEKVGEKSRDINTTIKIAEKRAKMDACLSLGFSDYFTQDIGDDSAGDTPAPAKNSAAAKAESRWATPKKGEESIETITVFSWDQKQDSKGATYAKLDTSVGQISSWKVPTGWMDQTTYQVKIESKGNYRNITELVSVIDENGDEIPF